MQHKEDIDTLKKKEIKDGQVEMKLMEEIVSDCRDRKIYNKMSSFEQKKAPSPKTTKLIIPALSSSLV